ncbi:MAG: hypothetical protein JST58_13460 [Bacteroidetes bacterium]|nr:hypothetical protein [Bacteroidota bacterium]
MNFGKVCSVYLLPLKYDGREKRWKVKMFLHLGTDTHPQRAWLHIRASVRYNTF